MSSLARISKVGAVAAALLGLLGVAGCGDSEPVLYIKDFNPPFISALTAGARQKIAVVLSQPVKQKTYVDMEISAVDQPFVHTDPADYVIFGVDKNSADVEVIASSSVTAERSVSIIFRIRDTQESREFNFTLAP